MKHLILLILFLISTGVYSQNQIVMNQSVYMRLFGDVYLVVDNANANAITTVGSGGSIISESENNLVKWNIGTTTGNYVIPFATNSLVQIPLAVNITGAGVGSGDVLFSTYETTTDANTTYPSDVTNMNSNCNTNNGLFAVDRFWRIEAESYTTKPMPVIDFGYDDAANEIGVTNTITESKLKAERYNAGLNQWETPQKLYGLANAGTNHVSGVSVTPADFHKSWTLIDTTIMTIPVTAFNDTICNGMNAIINVAGATTYTLMPGNLNSIGDFTISPVATTGYTVSGTIGTGTATCSSNLYTNGSSTVLVNATPTIAVVGNSVICGGASSTLSANGAANYLWDNGATTTAIVTTPSVSTSYTAVGTNTYVTGICADTAVYNVIVNTTPTVAIAGNSVICSGASSSLSASGATNYLWNNGATTSSVITTPSVSTSYTAVGTNTYATGICADTAMYSVIVNATPTVAIAGNSVICSGASSTLSASGATNYLWDNGVSATSIIATPSVSTSYTAVGTNTYVTGICADTTVYSIVVNATPIVAIAGNSVICSGASSTLSASGATNYLWNNGATTSSVITTPSVSTSYTAIGTNTYVTGICADTAMYSITVNPSPNLSVTGNSVICSGTNGTITANGALTYTWMPTTGLITVNDSIAVVNPSATSSYTVFGTTAMGCLSVGNYTMSVVKTPTLMIAAKPPVICAGSTSTISATGASNYTWMPSASVNLLNDSTVNVQPNVSSTYTVYGSNGVSPNLCTASSTIELIVTPLPILATSEEQFVCEGQNVSVFVNGASTYTWDTAPGIYEEHDSTQFIKNLPAGVYVYTITGTINNCSSIVTLTVNVMDPPIVNAGLDTVINIDESLVLHGIGNVPVGFISTTTGAPLSCNYCAMLTVAPTESTCYILEGISEYGCRNTDEVCVKVTKDWSVYIPNAFTPNGDLMNELFEPMGYGIEKIDLFIFDRWGNQLFFNNGKGGWDGFYEGKLCQQGVYVYKAEIKTMGGMYFEKAGHVTLLPLIVGEN